MDKGYVILAQNTSTIDYVKQAYLLALSIKATQTDVQCVSLVTNNDVPEKYKKVFDNIIAIPWTDDAEGSEWKIENRWKLYHVTPYQETIVLDSDMLFLTDVSHWWKDLNKHQLFFTTNVFDYRGNEITSDYYRKTFTKNYLKNIYSGIYYFKKCDFAHTYFKNVELICKNWELFYTLLHPEQRPDFMSMDVVFALTARIMDVEDQVVNKSLSYPAFVHMKPFIQNWKNVPETWKTKCGSYFTSDLELKIGNFKQSGVFHYTEDEFVTTDIIEAYEHAMNMVKE